MGGADPAGAAGASVCSEFMLAVSCSQASTPLPGTGTGGFGGAGVGPEAAPGPATVAVLGAERRWLRHAFNPGSPEAGECR